MEDPIFKREEKLISLYRARPSLWDSRLKDYHNRDVKARAINEIAADLQISGYEVRKKLHSLRTSFTNERRRLSKIKSGQEGERKKPSKKYKLLKFLNSVRTVRTQSYMIADETQSKDDTDETSLFNEFNENSNEPPTQMCEMSDEEAMQAHRNLLKISLNNRSMSSTNASLKNLSPSKKKRLDPSSGSEQESTTTVTSSFNIYLDSILKCLTDVEREEIEIDVLNFVHAKKKEILEKRVSQPIPIQSVERLLLHSYQVSRNSNEVLETNVKLENEELEATF